MRIRSRVTHTLGLVAVVSILSIAGYAFTASNTVPASNAGDGNGTVSGYTVSNITWGLINSMPHLYTGVIFDLTPIGGGGPPTVVKVRFSNSPPATFYTCTNIFGTTWSCGFGALPVLGLTDFRVIAVE